MFAKIVGYLFIGQPDSQHASQDSLRRCAHLLGGGYEWTPEATIFVSGPPPARWLQRAGVAGHNTWNPLLHSVSTSRRLRCASRLDLTCKLGQFLLQMTKVMRIISGHVALCRQIVSTDPHMNIIFNVSTRLTCAVSRTARGAAQRVSHIMLGIERT